MDLRHTQTVQIFMRREGLMDTDGYLTKGTHPWTLANQERTWTLPSDNAASMPVSPTKTVKNQQKPLISYRRI
jgi:hypothetical protein